MQKRFLFSTIAAVLAVAASPVAAQSDSSLKRIADDYWAYTLDQFPVFGSSLGVDDPQGRIRDVSLEAADKRAQKAQVWLDQLDAPGIRRVSMKMIARTSVYCGGHWLNR